MIRAVVISAAFLAVLPFPWPLALVLAAVAAFFSPLSALALGLFADTLYYAPGAYPFPLASLVGALLALLGFFVRKFAATSIISR